MSSSTSRHAWKQRIVSSFRIQRLTWAAVTEVIHSRAQMLAASWISSFSRHLPTSSPDRAQLCWSEIGSDVDSYACDNPTVESIKFCSYRQSSFHAIIIPLRSSGVYQMLSGVWDAQEKEYDEVAGVERLFAWLIFGSSVRLGSWIQVSYVWSKLGVWPWPDGLSEEMMCIDDLVWQCLKYWKLYSIQILKYHFLCHLDYDMEKWVFH